MHTLMIILGGFALLAVAIIVTRTTGRTFKSVLPLTTYYKSIFLLLLI